MFIYGPKDAADNQRVWNAVKYQFCNGFGEAPEKEAPEKEEGQKAIQWMINGQDTVASKWNDVQNWRANYINDTNYTTRYRVAQGVSLLPLFCITSSLTVFSVKATSSPQNCGHLVPRLSFHRPRESPCLLLVR